MPLGHGNQAVEVDTLSPVLGDQDPPWALFVRPSVSPAPWEHSLGNEGIETGQALRGISRGTFKIASPAEAGMERCGEPGIAR